MEGEDVTQAFKDQLDTDFRVKVICCLENIHSCS